MPEPNIPMLRKEVAWVEEQAARPEIDREWFQGTWVFRGWERAKHMAWGVARQLGYHEAEVDELADLLEPFCGTSYCVAGHVVHQYADPGVQGSTRRIAQELLGLSKLQADQLFNGDNSAADIRWYAEHFAGEKL